MARPKGQPKLGGRQKGGENKVTKELKEMILGALDESGGQKYLTEQAKANPVAFMNLLSKIIPKDIKHSGDADNPIRHFGMIKLVALENDTNKPAR